MGTTADRRRRSTTEVKHLITEAASAEFVENGFAGTTIRAIARRAGVTESMVFRHFDSKSELFRSTAAAPLVEFITAYIEALNSDPLQDPREVTYRFVSDLYDLCSTNRQILASLATGTTDPNHDDTEVAENSPLSPPLHALIEGVHRYMADSGVTATGDMQPTVRLAVAAVLGAALAGEALFPPETGIDIRSALTQFILLGSGYPPSA